MGAAEQMENSSEFNNLKETEKAYVLHAVTNPDASGAESARQAGIPESGARQAAYKMNQKPEVQKAIADLRERVGNTEDIDVVEFVNQSLLAIAAGEGADRDKLSALQMLGKTKKMFIDVAETTEKQLTDEEILDQVEKDYGKEARRRAAENMGIDE